jgi:hypothetical protein
MMKFSIITLSILLLFNSVKAQKYDICIYGATSAGVIAAYTAKQKGKSVILLDPGFHIGGLSSGGLGQTDIGNKYAITGVSRDFYRKIGKHYGKFEQWTFEPKVAKGIFLDYLKKVDKILLKHELVEVIKTNNTIKSLRFEDRNNSRLLEIEASVFIDCTYEGDLMAKAGVSYTIGREPNEKYHETWNGVQLLDKHQFPDGIDPFVEKGVEYSGLLWGISPEPLAAIGSGDKKMQAYNFRMCLTDSLENSIPISAPEDYNPGKYELLLRYIEAKKPHELNWALMHLQPMPNRKLDINNSGPFSTNLIGGNYLYPEANYREREKIVNAHVNHIKGFFYFLGNDPSVPVHLRDEMKKWGYPKDEYVDNNHFSPQMYVREGRRMISEVVMTEHHCVGTETVKDGIGLAAYTMDSHNTQRIIVKNTSGKWEVKNEGDVQKGLGGLDPYPISYKSIVPIKTECANLLVPVALSASHIAFGSIRMEPVFMVLAQSAATAAAMALDSQKSVQEIDVDLLQKILKTDPLVDGSTPEILVDNAQSTQFEVKGEFKVQSKQYGRYGKDYVRLGKDASATFTSQANKAGQYDLYVYVPVVENLAKNAQVEVKVGRKTTKRNLELQNKENEWYHLGSFSLGTNQSIAVEIKNIHSDPMIADAVLWVPKN